MQNRKGSGDVIRLVGVILIVVCGSIALVQYTESRPVPDVREKPAEAMIRGSSPHDVQVRQLLAMERVAIALEARTKEGCQ